MLTDDELMNDKKLTLSLEKLVNYKRKIITIFYDLHTLYFPLIIIFTFCINLWT